MYLWNTNALTKELKEGTLTEGEKFKYLLANGVLYAFALELVNYLPVGYFESAVLMSIFNILAVIVGTYICYQTNGGSGGVKFMERYICLSPPVTIKITVLFIAVGLVLEIVAQVLMGVSAEGTILDSAFLIVLSIIYYWRLNVHIKSISHNDTGAAVV